jgi:5-methylcytosine-specific restriction enzyme subunit McrC|tara:strand:+ start:583 stop:1911 length:1329 start_codon:yes stop_codon:yes gene_type:complete
MTKPIVELYEHKTSSSEDIIEELTNKDYIKNKKILDGKKLETKEDLKLKKDLEGILTVKELRNGIEISPTSYIGTIEFSEFIVKVFPKYSMESKNINILFNYIWNVEPQIQIKFLDSSINVEEEENTLLVDVIINSLIQQCELLLKQGLVKTYVVHEDNVSFLRGKLLIKEQIQNNMRKNVKFGCQFDELEHNNLENQILLAALSSSHNITNDNELKRKLRLLMYQYSTFTEHIPILSQDFDKIMYNKLNQHYEPAHDLSRLVLEASGFKEYRKEKQIKIKPFFINMDDVFEKFVEKLIRFYYSKYISEYKIQPQQTTKAWKSKSLQDKNMRTDILVTKIGTDKKFILDTKYKDHLSPNDRYQIGFYIHEFKQAEGTALLPEFTGSVDDDLTSAEKKIELKLKRININKIIGMIDEGKMDKSLHDEIGKFIREDMQVPFKKI